MLKQNTLNENNKINFVCSGYVEGLRSFYQLHKHKQPLKKTEVTQMYGK